MAAEPDIEGLEVRLFLEAIHARYGYDLRSYASPSIRRRVRAALDRSRARDLGELQHRVLTEPACFASVLEDLTVRVSELFRDPRFLRAFRARVVPLLRTYPLIKIWHAGCASGEEVYTTAILLGEEGLYDRAQLYGTDLSPSALAEAREGTYPASRLAAFARNHAASGGTTAEGAHCTEAYGAFTMNASLRRNVHFFHHDLVTDQPLGDMHVICCRNVLIYFDPPLKERVLAKLAQSLRPGGFLCLGATERLPPTAEGRFTEFDADHRIYRFEG